MPLLDHFRPPLQARRHWHSFHNAWATFIAADLNSRLPERYYAEPNVQFGIEIDVATFEEPGATSPDAGLGGAWTPPAPALTVPLAIMTDIVEVLVFNTTGGPTLAGAIELVSPANKDRPDNRDAFVAKCCAYLQQGVGLVIVDVVTERVANLHNELLARVAGVNGQQLQADLYAVAYHPVQRNAQTKLDIWPTALTIGQPLPTLPLCLLGGPSLPIELEATYDQTCRELRVPLDGA